MKKKKKGVIERFKDKEKSNDFWNSDGDELPTKLEMSTAKSKLFQILSSNISWC